MQTEALRLALEALEDIGDEWGFTSQRTVPKRKEAITAIKEALAQPEQDGECKHCTDGCPACDARKLPEQDWIERERAVGYREGHRAALAQRTWVGLTDEEINLIYSEPQTHIGQYARAIEAKLKDKNI